MGENKIAKYKAYESKRKGTQKALKRYLNKTSNKYESVIYSVEKYILEGLLSDLPETQRNEYLDFACGPGRIIQFTKKFFKNCYGADINITWLNYAK